MRSLRHAQVAQLVEHATENRSVAGSIPALGTTIPAELIKACSQSKFTCVQNALVQLAPGGMKACAVDPDYAFHATQSEQTQLMRD